MKIGVEVKMKRADESGMTAKLLNSPGINENRGTS
jgi:hypothetical protein